MAKVRQKTRGQAAAASGSNRILWLTGILILLLLVVGVVAAIGRGNPAPVDAALYEGVPAEGRFLGEADAPVLVREFIDFKCPHCGTASRDLIPRVIADYVADGQVRLEFIPLAILDGSQPGAEASLCAEEQGRFMAYHDLLFANQTTLFDIENLTNLAGQAGLDEQQFRACLTEGKYTNQVTQEHLTDFRNTGADSTPATPTFFVNDVKIEGAVPYEQLQAAIEGELNP
ncbi:MAG: DsbA family protein [Ardenticatenaceae bacterium]